MDGNQLNNIRIHLVLAVIWIFVTLLGVYKLTIHKNQIKWEKKIIQATWIGTNDVTRGEFFTVFSITNINGGVEEDVTKEKGMPVCGIVLESKKAGETGEVLFIYQKEK